MRNYITRSILVMMVLALGLSGAYAERVTQEDAALVASNFMFVADTSSSQGAKAPARPMSIKRVSVAEDAQYYVYENANGGGWVMVAANDVVQPILAYSKEGVFNPAGQPSNVKVWMNGYNKQIKYAEENNVEATEEVAEAWRRLRTAPPVTASGNVVVAPLIKTTWDQDSPYWNNCPTYNGSTCYTGCVATAMAQVMNYWQWPETGTGSYSYTTTTNKLSCSANFGSTTYDWANMVDHYTKYYSGSSQVSVSSTTTAQKNAVATLMYHCGVAVAMDYGVASQGGSSAYTIYPNSSYTTTRCAAYALKNNFGYNSSTLKCYYRSGGYGYSSVSDANWLNLLKTELDAKRPIMYAGADSEGGHSFICDGYDDQNYFHFNWGWSGYCDGYYTVDNMVPGTGGSGSGNGSYNDGQDIIIGIQPPQTGHKVVVNGTGCTITPDATHVKNGVALTATITPTDATYDFTSITVKLGTTTLSSTSYTMSSDNKTLTVNASAITGDASNNLTITCVWTKNRYSYSLLGTNCTEELEGMLNKNASLSLTITPDNGYTLADAACWTVEMGSNMLTYGTGFTYNSSTSTFYIASVTGDVTILAEAGRQITWRANGSVHATNLTAEDKIILPTDPEDCSGSNGKKFVGWCTESNYSNASTAPTFAKDGDDYSVATYYAVYATESTSVGGSPVTVVENMSTSSPYVAQTGWTASAGGTYTSAGNYGSSSPSIKFSSTGDYVQSAKMDGAITAVSYWYKPQNSTGSIDFYVSTDGSTFTELSAEKVEFSSSSTAATKSITLSASSNYRAIKIVYTKTTSNVAVDDISITYGGSSTTYSDYSTVCGTPCSNKPSMSFANETVNKTTADGTFTQAVTITGKGSGQTVAYSSSDATIATVNNSGVVTLKGKVGSTTITASVDANGTYCAASASYTLNVTAAPIDVTLYYGGTSATITGQTNPYPLPTTGTYVADMCDGEWTFDGWYGSAYAKSTEQPEYITQLSATSSAYAVYKTTETSAGVSPRKGSSGTITITPSTANIPTSYGSANTFTEYSFADYKFKVQQMYVTGGKLQWRASGNSNGTGTMYNTQAFPGKISSIVLTYNSSDGSKNFTVVVGSTENPTGGTSITPTTSNLVYTFDCSSANADYFVLTNGSGAGYLDKIEINYGSGGGTTTTTYYATTPECASPVEPCALTDITLNTDNVNKSFTTGDAFSAAGLVVTANYSNCDSKTVTPASISSPVMSSAGSKTVTVTYTENEVTKTATYTITVTDPVTYTVTWSVDGATTAVVYNEGAALVLPTAPADCEGGKTFMGWTASSSVDGSAPADLFTAASGTVTANATYYAVYAAVSSGGGSGAFDGEKEGDYKIYAQVGDTKYYATGTGSKISSTTNEAEATAYTFEKVTGGWAIKTGSTYITYSSSTNLGTSDNDAYTWTLVSGTKGTWRINSGTSGRGWIYRAGSTNQFGGYSTSNVTADGTEYYDVEISGGSGTTTYSDYSLTCAAPVVCALTGITLNTAGVTTSFTTGDTFSAEGLVVTANYSNCDSETITPTSISSPDMSSAGSQAITVSYTENGTTKTATYIITVSAPVVKHIVTWYACGSVFKTEQYDDGDSLVLPSPAPGANTEGKAFYGWITDEHYTGATAPETVSAGGAVNADASYYAIYH